MYEPLIQSAYGPLAAKVSLDPDFFTGLKPECRKAATDREAAFYRSITDSFSVDSVLDKHYVSVTARDGAVIPVKVYRAKNAKAQAPALLFIHGGGFITCTPETHDFVPAYIAAKTGTVCFSPDYRLAPEHKFPTGLNDCGDVLRWMGENAGALGLDAGRIAVGGDSSGGNFTAALTQSMRAADGVKIQKQVLIYPALDFSGDVPKKSAQVYAMVGTAGDEGAAPEPTFLERYLSPGDDVRDPRISPLLARDFSGLPEALFIQAECDALCDDGLIYAKLLQDAGVKVQCVLYSGMPHAFILRTYTETFEALNRICAFLK